VTDVSPDCESRSHRACSGDSWDFDLDGPDVCPCDCHTIAGLLTTPAAATGRA
jgi:hypothetical protein